MRNITRIMMGWMMVIGTAVPAFAVDTSKTYSSGLLVGLFLAFCALIVVVQLMPTIMLLIGFVKGLFKSSEKQARRQGSRA